MVLLNRHLIMRVFRKPLFFLFIFFQALVVFGSDSLSILPLKPEPQHSLACKKVTESVQAFHYRKFTLNDSMSAKIFDKYIKDLDYNKMYFTQADINEFQKYKFRLDDDLKSGDLDAAYIIYNRFRKHQEERADYALSIIDKSFDFTPDQTYKPERKDAPWASTQAEMDSIWYERIKYEALNLKIAGKDEEGNTETMEKRYINFKKQLAKMKSEDAFQIYMNAFAESVDPHTNYFSPRLADQFKIDMSQSLEGIGATLRTENDFTKVVEVVKGGPADKSKLVLPNDKIIAVGQGEAGEMEDVIGWRIDDVVSKIRGPKGTIVRLQIIAASDPNGAPKIISITREKVKLEEQSAKSEIKEIQSGSKKIKVGVITVPTFYLDYAAMQKGEPDYKSTNRDVRVLLKKLQDEKVEGVVMDLRNNGGGSLLEAIELSGLFIKDGPVVQVRQANGSVDVEQDGDPKLVYGGPMVVLVNKFSASASEIFAGAMQDYNRALVVGETTFGKGTVQNIFDLKRFLPMVNEPLGQFKLTTAKFYRVNGSSTQHKGVVPDISFPSPLSDKEYGESAEESALPWDEIQSARFVPFGDLSSVKPIVKKNHDKRMDSSSEYKYLLQDITEFEKRRADNTLTLNEEKLRKERADNEARDLERYNQRRVSQGLKPLAKGEEKPKDEKNPDFILDEGCEILCDLIQVQGKTTKVAATSK